MVSRIRELCKSTNDSFFSLEKKLGLGNGSVSRWDKNIPSADKLQKVADYFNVSTDYLLGRTDSPSFDPPTLVLTPDEQAAVEAFLAVYRAKKDS